MQIPVNAKSEGRVLVPWEHQAFPNMTEQDSSKGIAAMLGGEFLPDWRADGNVWESFRLTCPPGSEARRLYSSIRGGGSDELNPRNYFTATKEARNSNREVPQATFALNTSHTYPFCSQPHTRYLQGHFFSDWRTIPVLYPIFSSAKAQGYADILIPSHFYYTHGKKYTYGWDERDEVVRDLAEWEERWEEKKIEGGVYWRGDTSGGGSSPPGFVGEFQRHR